MLFIDIPTFNPNRSLDRYSVVRYGEDNFLPSSIFLLVSCFSFILAVARYAFEQTTNNLLNNKIKSVQALMTDWGLRKCTLIEGYLIYLHNAIDDGIDGEPANGVNIQFARDVAAVGEYRIDGNEEMFCHFAVG